MSDPDAPIQVTEEIADKYAIEFQTNPTFQPPQKKKMTPEIDYDLLAIALMSNPKCRSILMSAYKEKVNVSSGDINKQIRHEVKEHISHTLGNLNIAEDTKDMLRAEVTLATTQKRQQIEAAVSEFMSSNKFNIQSPHSLENMLIAEIKKIAQEKIAREITSIRETTSAKVKLAIKNAFKNFSVNINGEDILDIECNHNDNDWDD